MYDKKGKRANDFPSFLYKAEIEAAFVYKKGEII